MIKRLRATGIFENLASAEAALLELDRVHFSLDRTFVIARNIERETEVVGSELCESLRDRFDERISSIALQDSGIVNGEIVITLTKALVQLDIPFDLARFYNDMVARGQCLVMIEGSREDILNSKTILRRGGLQNWVVCEIVSEHPEIIVVDHRKVA